MKFKFLGIEVVIHDKPIKYDPMGHFHEEIDERLQKIVETLRKNKKL